MSFNTQGSLTSQPTLGILNQNSQPKQSNVLSGMTIPNQTPTQNTGLISGGQNIQVPKVTQPGLISNTASSNTHTTVTNPTTGASTTKPTPNPSVLEQQKSLNQQNVNTPGYVPLIEDGLAGPKTSAALAQYGYNTTTGQKNNPTPTSTPTSTPITTPATTTPVGAGGAATGGSNTGSTGVNQGVLIGNLANQSQTPSQGYTDAVNKYGTIAGQLEALKSQEAQQTSDINQSGTWTSRAMGEQGQANIQNAATEAALGSQLTAQGNLVNAANTQQGLQVTAGTNAANANAPMQVPYSNQVISPSTGQSVGGGTAGQLPQQAQDAVNSYAQQVKSGQMTRADAESRLSAYGVAGTNALNTALGTSFNTNASNASAGTTAQGQQIQTAAKATNDALDTLTGLFNNLSPLQTQGIPATNSLANWVAGALGSQALSQYKTNLADARSQLIGVLNSSGGTPTGNEATANQYLPDNMTKAQFDANVGTAQNPGIVRQLVAQKVGRFTGSGSQNGTSGSTTGGGTITTPGGLTINPNF